MHIAAQILLAGAFWFFTGAAFSQAPSASHPSVAEQRRELIAAIEQGDRTAILELGRLGGRSVIPRLTKIASGPETSFHSAPANARMALARLGDHHEFKRIVDELHSSEPVVQDQAIEKLAYIGGLESIKVLMSLLDDKKLRNSRDYDPNLRGPHGELPQGDIVYASLSHMAMRALSRIAPNPPVAPGTEPKEEYIPLWRKWWGDVGSKLKKTPQ